MTTTLTPPCDGPTEEEGAPGQVLQSPVPGAMIMRGPMAGDNYTQLHNRIARGEIIPIEYVGVYTYINSHTEGWTLTEQRLAQKIGKSRGFVSKALAFMEQAGLLFRSQSRQATGKFGSDGVWVITDLAVQLADLGVTDPKILSAKLEAVFADAIARAIAARQNPSPSPLSKKETSAPPGRTRRFHSPSPLSKKQTSVPPAQTGSLSSSSPSSGLPSHGEMTPKKTKEQEDHPSEKHDLEKQENPSPPRSGHVTVQTRAPAKAASRRTENPLLYSEQIARVLQALPVELDMPHGQPPVILRRLIAAELQTRTVEDLCARVRRRWLGTPNRPGLANTEKIRKPVAVAQILLAHGRCPDTRCEDGILYGADGARLRACDSSLCRQPHEHARPGRIPDPAPAAVTGAQAPGVLQPTRTARPSGTPIPPEAAQLLARWRPRAGAA